MLNVIDLHQLQISIVKLFARGVMFQTVILLLIRKYYILSIFERFNPVCAFMNFCRFFPYHSGCVFVLPLCPPQQKSRWNGRMVVMIQKMHKNFVDDKSHSLAALCFFPSVEKLEEQKGYPPFDSASNEIQWQFRVHQLYGQIAFIKCITYNHGIFNVYLCYLTDKRYYSSVPQSRYHRDVYFLSRHIRNPCWLDILHGLGSQSTIFSLSLSLGICALRNLNFFLAFTTCE